MFGSSSPTGYGPQQSLDLCGSRYVLKESTPDCSKAPFLNLPLDIINLVMKYLPYCGRASLSLTCKGLRHLAPDRSASDSPGTESSRTIYSLLLSQDLQYRRHNINNVSAPRGPESCSYCTQQLCPPTCPTALFLDYATGIFYPASLYPINQAVSAPTDGFSEKSGCKRHFVPGDSLPKWDNSPARQNTVISLRLQYDDMRVNSMPAVYKTIWCEHHRCPPSLLSANFHQEDVPMGPYRFYGDYYTNGFWSAVRKAPSFSTNQIPPVSRCSVKNIPSEDIAAMVSSPIAKIPNARSFYHRLCRHCYLPLWNPEMSEKVWFGRTCRCWISYDSSMKGKEIQLSTEQVHSERSVHCGCVFTVRFTVIEAFEPVVMRRFSIPFSLVLASEVELLRIITPSKKEQIHLVDVNASQIQQSVDIIRFRDSNLSQPGGQTGDCPHFNC